MKSQLEIVLAIVALTCGVAHADTIKPPPGWKLDAGESKVLTLKLSQLGYFDLPPPSRANADVYVAPKLGASLFVIMVGSAIKDQHAEAARWAVDDLHATSSRAGLSGSHIVEDAWQEKVDPHAKQIEAMLAFRDTGAKTSSTSRRLIVATADSLIFVTGECFASDDADAAMVAGCKAALATLDPGLPVDQRVDLALAPVGARPKFEAPEPAAGSSGSTREPARMDDGSRAPLPPMTVPQEPRTTDRRPVYVGIGLVVFAAIFWWNRHRRARREDESDER